MHTRYQKVCNTQKIPDTRTTPIVLVVPYIMNKCTFGITAQGDLRTSKLNSPLTSNLFMRFLVMDSPSLLHHLVRKSLRIQMVGILD